MRHLPPDVVSALGDYVRAWRRAARVRAARRPQADAVELRPEQAWWRRVAVSHGGERLPADRHVEAAFGGLQDSDPRSALLSLHARLHDVGPDAWEQPSLAQVWLRWSDYVIPRSDAAVFTVGAKPRDPRHGAAVDQLTDVVLSLLVNGRRNGREIAEALPELPNPTWIRASGVSGRVLIRWDTRTTTVVEAPAPAPSPSPPMSPDEARRELARRFLHWRGPSTPDHFARWAGITREDADATWRLLDDELAAVAVHGRGEWLLAADLGPALGAHRPNGVRLLPAGDPCLHRAGDIPGPASPPPRRADPAADVTPRLLNSLTGRVLVDGEIGGAWARAGNRVTIDPWPALPRDRIDDVAEAAESLAGPIGQPIRLRWL